ncbi:hypothetical protein [Sphingorhabdus sp. M41]|nr:hypothetical protein [Sphingorhabdus sp. M41]
MQNTVIASVAKQSSASLASLDCRVACAPRNDDYAMPEETKAGS